MTNLFIRVLAAALLVIGSGPSYAGLVTQRGTASALAFGWAAKTTVSHLVVDIGTASVGSVGSTLALTVPSGGVPAGSAIYVYLYEGATAGAVTVNGSVADNAGTPNSYTEVTGGSEDGASSRLQVFQAYNSNALTSGKLISYTPVVITNGVVMSAFYITNVSTNPYDSGTKHIVTFGGANPAANQSGTPSVAGEIFLASAGWSSIPNPGYSLDTGNGWAGSPPDAVQVSTASDFIGTAGGEQLNSGTGKLTTQPTFSTSTGVFGSTIVFGIIP